MKFDIVTHFLDKDKAHCVVRADDDGLTLKQCTFNVSVFYGIDVDDVVVEVLK